MNFRNVTWFGFTVMQHRSIIFVMASVSHCAIQYDGVSHWYSINVLPWSSIALSYFLHVADLAVHRLLVDWSHGCSDVWKSSSFNLVTERLFARWSGKEMWVLGLLIDIHWAIGTFKDWFEVLVIFVVLPQSFQRFYLLAHLPNQRNWLHKSEYQEENTTCLNQYLVHAFFAKLWVIIMPFHVT